MTTESIPVDEEIRELVDKNLKDENKLALHHRITFDVLEFIDISQLHEQSITFQDYEKMQNAYEEIRNDFINKHRVINSDFLLNKLKPIFDKNNTFVFEEKCETGNFNFDLYQIKSIIDELKETLEKLKKDKKNGNKK